MENKALNTIPEGSAKVFHASKDDNERTFRCELHEGVNGFTLAGTEALTLRYLKPNKEIGSVPVANAGGDYVDITVPDEMTDIAGVVYCKLRINGIGAKSLYLSIEQEV